MWVQMYYYLSFTGDGDQWPVFLQLKRFCEDVKEINICFDFRNQTNLSDGNFTFKLLTQNRWYRETVLDCMYVCSIYAAITLYVSSVIYIYSQVT